MYNPNLTGEIRLPELKVKIDRAVIKSVYGDHYTGDYFFIPTATGTILQTENKVMDEDFVVSPIPYEEVPNEAGGTTVKIACQEV